MKIWIKWIHAEFIRGAGNKQRAALVTVAALLIPIYGHCVDASAAFHLNPDFERGYNYSIGVKAGDFLYIGGVTAVDEAGNEVYAKDPRKQMQLIYERMKKILAAHGATFNNVVSETIYYKIPNNVYVDVLDVRAKFYKGMDGPSASGIKVADFASKNILIEIKAVAYLGK
ncbi:MAG: hypothetical protein NVS3B3_22480 [Aquirhabdus sp.]